MNQRLARHAACTALTRLAFLCILSVGCGSSMKNGQASSDLTSGSTTDGGGLATDGGDATLDAGLGPDGGQGAALLNIIDYNNGCSITEDGGAYRLISAFVVGSVVALDATPLPGYAWGYWTGTDFDGGGMDVKLATTVTMNENKLVVACCPTALPAAQVCPTPIP